MTIVVAFVENNCIQFIVASVSITYYFDWLFLGMKAPNILECYIYLVSEFIAKGLEYKLNNLSTTLGKYWEI